MSVKSIWRKVTFSFSSHYGLQFIYLFIFFAKSIFKRELKLLALLHLCIFSLDFSNLLLVPRLFSILEQFYSIWNNLILFGTILFFLEQFCSFWNNSIPVGIILFFLEQFYSFWNNFVPFGIILILFSFNIFLYFQAFKNFFF